MDVLNWITYWKPELFEKQKCQAALPRIIAFAPLLFCQQTYYEDRGPMLQPAVKNLHIVAAFAWNMMNKNIRLLNELETVS